MEQNWVIKRKTGDVRAIAEEQNVSEITAQLLLNRNLITKEQRDVYLHPSVYGLRDPALLLNAVKAAEMLKKAVADGLRIRIIGDYDVDGITSTYVLYTALSEAGADVSYRIPDRIADGYGINTGMVDDAYNDGVDLILTCDNGISEYDTVKHAKDLGMKFILTDHHEIPTVLDENGNTVPRLPLADIIVNPHQPGETYPFPDICGCVVALKVMECFGADIRPFLPYAALATYCDVMDLCDENRVIVILGLSELRRTTDPGLSALISANALNRDRLSAYHIGFVIGPCLNASGRLDTAEKAVGLLLEKDPERAEAAAAELVELNRARKDMTEQGAVRAGFIIDTVAKRKAELAGDPENPEKYIDRVLVINLKDCHESIAGIIAGRVKDKYNRPTFVFTNATNDEDGVKGSGRSIEAYSMYEELCRVKDLLKRFGGHPMAAGLSLEADDLPAFQERINENCTLTADQLKKKVRIDMKLPFGQVDNNLIEEIQRFEPFGKGNEKILFAEKDLRVLKASVIGKTGNLLKLNLINTEGFRFPGLYFGDIPDFFDRLTKRFGKDEVDKMLKGLTNNVVFSATYTPEKNEYNGIVTLQAKIGEFLI